MSGRIGQLLILTDEFFKLLFEISNQTTKYSISYRLQMSRVRSPALPDFLISSGSGTGSTQPREPREVN